MNFSYGLEGFIDRSWALDALWRQGRYGRLLLRLFGLALCGFLGCARARPGIGLLWLNLAAGALLWAVLICELRYLLPSFVQLLPAVALGVRELSRRRVPRHPQHAPGAEHFPGLPPLL